MNKVKSEYESGSSSLNTNTSKMPTYTPSKKPKKSMSSKLRGKSVSRSASDYSSESDDVCNWLKEWTEPAMYLIISFSFFLE